MYPERSLAPAVRSDSPYQVLNGLLYSLSGGAALKIAVAVVNGDERGREIVIALDEPGNLSHADGINIALYEAGFDGLDDKRIVSTGGGEVARDQSGVVKIYDYSSTLKGPVPDALVPIVASFLEQKVAGLG